MTSPESLQRLEVLLDCPIPEVAEAARQHDAALTEHRAASRQRAEAASRILNADATDAHALEAAVSAGRPAPAPIDRNALEVQRSDAARREAAYGTLTERAYHAAVRAAREHAPAWIDVLDAEHRTARADLSAALVSVREAAARLDEINSQSSAARHLLTEDNLRTKFITHGVGTAAGVLLLADVEAYQQRSPGEWVADRLEEQGRAPAPTPTDPTTRAFNEGRPAPRGVDAPIWVQDSGDRLPAGWSQGFGSVQPFGAIAC